MASPLRGVTRCPRPIILPSPPAPTHSPKASLFSKKPYFSQWGMYSKPVLRARGCCGEDLTGLCCFLDSASQQAFIQLLRSVRTSFLQHHTQGHTAWWIRELTRSLFSSPIAHKASAPGLYARTGISPSTHAATSVLPPCCCKYSEKLNLSSFAVYFLLHPCFGRGAASHASLQSHYA